MITLDIDALPTARAAATRIAGGVRASGERRVTRCIANARRRTKATEMTARLALLGVAALLAAPSAALAQPAGKTPRVAYITSGTETASAGMVRAFRDGMRELGWIEGGNVVIDYRFAEGRFERLPKLAGELARERSDVVVAATSAAVVAARDAFGTTPIVMVNVTDPTRLGLVANLARPGGSITGLSSSFGSELWAKQLQLLTEAVPTARRVAVLSNPANPGHAIALGGIRDAARPLGISLQFLEARAVTDLNRAFGAMAGNRAEALMVVSDPLFGSNASQLAELEARHRLPAMHGTRANLVAGGLLLYGPNLVHQSRQAAAYVDKILKGAKPGDLSVQQPTKFDFVVNLKTARTLGLTIPPSLLLRADEVVE